ncbi:hypothetical protein EBS02_05065, partial [bacterium]|nr:hypothetical protein [bacterium]
LYGYIPTFDSVNNVNGVLAAIYLTSLLSNDSLTNDPSRWFLMSNISNVHNVYYSVDPVSQIGSYIMRSMPITVDQYGVLTNIGTQATASQYSAGLQSAKNSYTQFLTSYQTLINTQPASEYNALQSDYNFFATYAGTLNVGKQFIANDIQHYILINNAVGANPVTNKAGVALASSVVNAATDVYSSANQTNPITVTIAQDTNIATYNSSGEPVSGLFDSNGNPLTINSLSAYTGPVYSAVNLNASGINTGTVLTTDQVNATLVPFYSNTGVQLTVAGLKTYQALHDAQGNSLFAQQAKNINATYTNWLNYIDSVNSAVITSSGFALTPYYDIGHNKLTINQLLAATSIYTATGALLNSQQSNTLKALYQTGLNSGTSLLSNTRFYDAHGSILKTDQIGYQEQLYDQQKNIYNDSIMQAIIEMYNKSIVNHNVAAFNNLLSMQTPYYNSSYDRLNLQELLITPVLYTGTSSTQALSSTQSQQIVNAFVDAIDERIVPASMLVSLSPYSSIAGGEKINFSAALGVNTLYDTNANALTTQQVTAVQNTYGTLLLTRSIEDLLLSAVPYYNAAGQQLTTYGLINASSVYNSQGVMIYSARSSNASTHPASAYITQIQNTLYSAVLVPAYNSDRQQLNVAQLTQAIAAESQLYTDTTGQTAYTPVQLSSMQADYYTAASTSALNGLFQSIPILTQSGFSSVSPLSLTDVAVYDGYGFNLTIVDAYNAALFEASNAYNSFVQQLESYQLTNPTLLTTTQLAYFEQYLLSSSTNTMTAALYSVGQMDIANSIKEVFDNIASYANLPASLLNDFKRYYNQVIIADSIIHPILVMDAHTKGNFVAEQIDNTVT